jgi:hypothetical protein
MSKEIKSMYRNMDKSLNKSPVAKESSSGLLSQRSKPVKEESSVAEYVKQIRKIRGESNARRT